MSGYDAQTATTAWARVAEVVAPSNAVILQGAPSLPGTIVTGRVVADADSGEEWREFANAIDYLELAKCQRQASDALPSVLAKDERRTTSAARLVTV